MNSILSNIINSISRQNIDIKNYVSNGFNIVKTQLRYTKDCIDFIGNRTEASANLILTFKGFSKHNNYLNDKNEIDKLKFKLITEEYLKRKEKIDNWDLNFQTFIKNIDLESKKHKKFFLGYDPVFIPIFKEMIEDLFLETQIIMDTILLLGLHKFMISGPRIISTREMYNIAEIILEENVEEKHELLGSFKLQQQLVMFLLKFHQDIV